MRPLDAVEKHTSRRKRPKESADNNAVANSDFVRHNHLLRFCFRAVVGITNSFNPSTPHIIPYSVIRRNRENGKK